MTPTIETLTPSSSETPTSDTVNKTSRDNVIGTALPIVAALVLNLIGAANLYSAFAASGLGDLGPAVPVLLCGGLELGIAACAFMAHRLRSNDRGSTAANALTWILSFVSAYIGYTHAVHLDWEPAVVGVVVGAPIAAALVWHIFLRTGFALAHGRARQDVANELLVRRAAAARMDSDRAARKYAKWKLVVWIADVRAYRAERAVTLGATVAEIAPLAARYETAVVRLDAALNGISTATSRTRRAAPRSDTDSGSQIEAVDVAVSASSRAPVDGIHADTAGDRASVHGIHAVQTVHEPVHDDQSTDVHGVHDGQHHDAPTSTTTSWTTTPASALSTMSTDTSTLDTVDNGPVNAVHGPVHAGVQAGVQAGFHGVHRVHASNPVEPTAPAAAGAPRQTADSTPDSTLSKGALEPTSGDVVDDGPLPESAPDAVQAVHDRPSLDSTESTDSTPESRLDTSTLSMESTVSKPDSTASKVSTPDSTVSTETAAEPVQGRRRRLVGGRLDPDLESEIRRRDAAGEDRAEIAKALGVSRSTVYNKLKASTPTHQGSVVPMQLRERA